MNDQASLQDMSSKGVFDFNHNQYSNANYPEKYSLELKSSCDENTQDLKSVRITAGQKIPHEIVIRFNAKLMSRMDQVRKTNEAIKHSNMAF